MRAALAAFSVLTLAACGDDPTPGPVLTVELVTPAGDDPAEGAELARLRVQQGSADVVEREVAVEGGGLSADIVLDDLVTTVRVGVEVVGPDGIRIGAPPPFLPIESGGLVRIPVGIPDSCAIMDGMTLGAGRAVVGVARHGTFALTVGGVAAEGPSAATGYLDLLELRAASFDDLGAPAGAARAVPYGSSESVVLSDAPFRYDIGSAEMPVLAADLHDGAGLSSAAVALRPRGAVVVGGSGPGDEPVAEVTWIDADGASTRSRLATPRAGAAAALVGSDVLVVGGHAAGAWAERLRPGADGEPLDLPDHGPRPGAVLVADADSGRALLLGGEAEDGTIRADTVVFTCAATCTAEPGPEWSRARTGFATVALPTGGGLLAGGDGPVDAVDRVTFEEDGVRIAPVGDLEAARGGASGLSIDAGLVFIVGGLGSGGPRADVEVCFPRSLALP